MAEFWYQLRDYTASVFDNSSFECGVIWESFSQHEPSFYIQKRGQSVCVLFCREAAIHTMDLFLTDSQRDCVKICIFAVNHRDESIEGIETFEKYLHYCIYEVTGAGFVKSGYKT